MYSEIKTFSYPNGELQRVQLVRPESWSQLNFLKLSYCEGALDCFAKIYEQYLIPACPWLFGNLVMFYLPPDAQTEGLHDTKKYGLVADRLTAAAAALEDGVKIIGNRPVFRNERVRNLWELLESRNCIRLIRGKLPVTTIIPVGNAPGFLSQTEQTAALKVNSSFFIMDRFDCATAYDHIGTHLGLCVKDGVVENPPLFGREALLVKKDGSISVTALQLSDLEIEIAGQTYAAGKNAVLFSRPGRARTPFGKGKELVVIGRRVAAVRDCGGPIPASGFVLRPKGESKAVPGSLVTYRGMEDVAFGIQVGNSIVIDGKKTEGFRSRFYNIRHLERVPFPPSLYPMDFKKARAARIALGADKDGKPMLLWAEGAGKLGYVPGTDSRGASLSDMAQICSELGMVNAVNLDGGGSAQILLNNKRNLLISDRNADHTEAERPVPVGLIIR